MLVEAEKFTELLAALAAGTCTAERWSEAAVTHYSSPLVEAWRARLVRQSNAIEGWDFNAPPHTLLRAVVEIQGEIAERRDPDIKPVDVPT